MTESKQDRQDESVEGIAVIGMAGRFPGAADLEAFWRNLRDGVEGIRSFSKEELLAAGVDPALLGDPRYVRAGGALERAEWFDAGFFGFTPREAEIMDPQHRLFLETTWGALEHAGYVPDTFEGVIGLFGGMSLGTYLLFNLLPNRDLARTVDPLQLRLLNDKDFLTSLVAYKLGLSGPCITVQTGCSTSLVATALACQSLESYQCDIAMAGGVSVAVPLNHGYLAQDGVTSPDGHCRAFDQDARGTVAGSGVGVVVLKRLADALADGDTIYAVIRGTAVNNDGALRVGFTAPSATGQQEVIAMAQAVADVPAETIAYVETHGTGTPLGDPIEVAALTRAFRKQTDRSGFCAIGSVKTNIGHLDAAAGVAGLIKTVLALHHAQIPPSLHFGRPNPQIDFADSPFYVSTQLQDWPDGPMPRRAGVSAFSMGGVNAHAVLEAAPDLPPSGPARPWQALLLSARSAAALEALTDNLVAHLRAHPELPLADIAYTSQVGRRAFGHRRVVLCREPAEAAAALEARDPARVQGGQAGEHRAVAFMFSGVGDQYLGMGQGLYQDEPVFREHLDRCAELLLPLLGLDLRDLLYPDRTGDSGNGVTPAIDLRAMVRGPAQADDAERRLGRIELLHPALFAVEYALARQWMAWGVRPQALIGYSIGEYVAACLAGVFSLEDALRCVVARAEAIRALPGGAMLTAELPAQELELLLGPELALAAVNGPTSCVVAGPAEAIDALEQRLAERGVGLRRVRADYAFHSPMMQPIVEPLARLIETIRLSPPRIPLIAGATGEWLTPEQAGDPRYWAGQIAQPVRFADGVGALWQESTRVLLEIGPGQGLGGWAARHPARPANAPVLPTLRSAYVRQSDQQFLLNTLGKLWLAGAAVDWAALYRHEQRRRVALPGYPFERRRYWIDAPAAGYGPAAMIAQPAEPAQLDAPPDATRATDNRPALTSAYAAPQTPAERALVELWQDLLGIRPIGIHDNFFELGGHSLLATQIGTRVRDMFQVELTIGDLFGVPTVAGLAEQIGTARPGVAEEAIPALARDGALALSPAQQRLWFIHQFDPNEITYNIPFAVRLSGPLDLAALGRSLDEIARRHEALRTTFAQIDGRPVQVIHPPQPVALPLVDLAGLPPDEREAHLERLLRAEADRPFDLADDPPIRVGLLRLGAVEHIVALTLHHIAADAWSVGVFLRELVALYDFYSGAPSAPLSAPLSALPIQYADYAAWQIGRLQGAVLEQQLDYWRARLAGAPLLELPADRPRPATQRFQGAVLPVALTPQLSEQIRALGRRAEATPFMVLMAAFNVLLMRYSGQEDICVGTPVANRTRLETEPLIGFFVNTLVLRTDLSGAPSFRELLARVRAAALEDFARAETPFELVVDAVQPERSLSHTPLFQALFVLQTVANMSAFDIALPAGLQMRARPTHNGTAKFDLTLDLAETPDGFSGVFEYSTDLFDVATIQRMAGHLARLLESLVAEPDRPITTLPMLSPQEHAQLLLDYNPPAPDFPAGLCLHQFVEMQAALRFNHTALVDGAERVSYGELERRANQLAHHLRSLGAGPETLVALRLERSASLVIALLATLKAGAAYLPIDPAAPAARVGLILDDARPAVLITKKEIGDWRLESDAAGQSPISNLQSPTVVYLDTDWEQIAQQPATKLESGVRPDHLAYVIYTSGSTGAPKGVMVTHASAVRLFSATAEWFSFGAEDVWTLFHSYAFDFSVWELWGALLHGGRLIVVPYLVSRDPDAFAALLRREQVTVLNQTPTAFRQLIPADAALGDELPPSALRYVIFGGEKLDPHILRPWFARYGDARPQLINMYGITETTVHVTYRPMIQADLECTPASPIGRQIPDLSLYVLDGQMQPVPLGVPGELYVGGAGLARGYLNRPELTAERFVPNPFAQERLEIGDWRLSSAQSPISNLQSPISGRLYKTGDLARRRADGELEYLGRLDQQVQLRGFRVELGEIAATLRRHEAVREAEVLAREDIPGQMRLVAYVIPRDWGLEIGDFGGGNLQSPISNLQSELRDFLKEQLPDYMVPTAFVMLSGWPLTPNGKLDRRALPAPTSERPELPSAAVQPRTPTEAALAAIWAQVLGLGQVGIHDNFFALGGDSIRSVQVLAHARAQGLAFTLPDLFQHPTIAGLSALIEPAPAGPEPLPLTPQPPTLEPSASPGLISAADRARLPATVADAYPPTALQSGMLFHNLARPDQGLYHDVFSFHLRLPLDLDRLRQAIDALVAGHPVLRTAFDLTGLSAPAQLVYREVEIPLGVEDLSALSSSAADEIVADWIATEKSRGFDWSRPPLLRFQIHRRGDGTFQLGFSFHHAILDGWSVATLLTELLRRYLQLTGDPTIAIPPPPNGLFRDYVELEQQALHSHEARDFWHERLHGSTALQLPRGSDPALADAPAEYPTVTVPLTGVVSDGLHRLAQQAEVPIKSVLLATHLRVLAFLGGGDDVLTGLVSHGRPEELDSERILGLFLNTLPLRLRLGAGDWRDLARATFAAERGIWPFRRYPLAAIQRLLGRGELFETAFNFTHFHVYQAAMALPGVEVLDEQLFERTNLSLVAQFGLDLETHAVTLRLDFDPAALSQAQVRRIGGYYGQVLAAMSVAPQQPYLAFAPTDAVERRRPTVARTVAPPTLTLHELFERQAARAPEATALVDGAERVSYGELERRANQLAHHLRSLGAGPETLVALRLERSASLVIALLATLKAGAAYLPIDPATPAARIGLILDDARPTVLLTTQEQRTKHKEQSTDSTTERKGVLHTPPADDERAYSTQPSAVLLTTQEQRTKHKEQSTDSTTDRKGVLHTPPADDERAYSTQPSVEHTPAADHHQPTVVELDVDWPTIARQPATTPESGATPDHLAYVIYTSGSTGAPKGVMVTHANAVRLFSATAEWFSFGAEDVWTLFHSYAFDFSVWELWGALLHGGRLVIVPYLVSRDPDAFAALLRREQVTVLNQTPTAFRQLIPADAALGDELPPSALRYVIFGGEKLGPHILRPWFARYGDARPQLINMYGITETTVHVTYHPLTRADLDPPAASLIGEPIPDLQLYVLDGQMQPVPLGVPGELYVGGAGLARGYLNRPELTAERFVPNPFAQERLEIGDWRVAGADATISNPQSPISDCLYKTGDLARRRADGELEYLGRLDQQVQLRGFRVELGEIAATLRRHEAVREAEVLAREDIPGQMRLVAYVIPRDWRLEIGDFGGGNLQSPISNLQSELRDFLKEQLSDYMVPSAFVMLSGWPLTPNGKLDRRALPAPTSERPELPSAAVQPRTPTEAVLAAIWAQVLGLGQVGIHDNFFALGGDSIRSVQVLAHARAQGLSFTLPDLLERPTVAGLSALIAAEEIVEAPETLAEPEAPAPPSTPFSLISAADRARLPASVADAYPPTALQSGMLFHNLAYPDQGYYHDVFSFHLRLRLDLDRLRQAVDAVVAGHPVLRTAFDLTGLSAPAQLVYREVAVPFGFEDLSGLNSAAADEVVGAWVERERRHYFDWSRPPLLRFQIHRRSAETFQIGISFHHAILDGWSMATLLTELLQRYLRLTSNPDQPLMPAPALQFRDYIALEQQALGSDEQRDFWRASLTGYARAHLPRWPQPAPTPGEPVQTAWAVPIPPAVSDGVYQLSRQASLPVKSVLLAAHMRVLAGLSGQDDVTTGLVVQGRPENSSSERVLGLFLNTLPLRLDMRGGTWLDLAQAAFEAEREILPFRRYPLAHIQRLAGAGELFEAIFNFTHFHVYHQVNKSTGIDLLDEIIVSRTNFALTANFGLNINSGAVTLRLDYDPAALPAAQVRRIGEYYVRALAELGAHPDAPYRAHSLLPDTERRRLLGEWNANGCRFEESRSLLELFEAQAARVPDSIALVDADVQFSYAELNRRANQLARALRRHRVGPETPVALALERSARQVIAALAVWKAGGAYMPLNPNDPPLRIAALLEEARPAVVLTQTKTRDWRLEIDRDSQPPISNLQSPAIIDLDADWPTIAQQPAGNLAGHAGPDNLAYIIYTSGSTGAPNGVMISHRSVHNLALALHAAIEPPCPGPLRVSLNAPLAFDASVKQLVQLAFGHTLVIIPEAARQDAEALLETIRRERVEWLDCTPTQMRMLLLAGLARRPELLPGLVLLGGEALDQATWDFLAAHPTARAYNVYGPTECTVDASISRVGAQAAPVIGRPITNAQLYILDRQMEPVPTGAPGELYIGGAGVARGYLNRPELTAQRFVPNPFLRMEDGGWRMEDDERPSSILHPPSSQLYKTGDLARHLPDGSVEYLGRRDQQVKLRGFRVELGEIRAALMRHPAVCEAAVLAREVAPGDTRLVAYIVIGDWSLEIRDSSGDNLQSPISNVVPGDWRVGIRDSSGDNLQSLISNLPQELRRYLNGRLPDYMIPAAYVELEALPLTPNGKLDQRALPNPAGAAEAGVPATAPRDALEQQIASLWAEALGLAQVGVHSSFMELGGHSLSALLLNTRLRERFGHAFPLADLLRDATVARQAQELREPALRPHAASALVDIKPGGSRRPFFCVHPASGVTFCYQELAYLLHPEQPFFGLQLSGFAEDQLDALEIPQIAAHYIAAIRGVQPEAPYLLGGWSVGGVIAFEIARQLRAAGQEVALLALFDSAPRPVGAEVGAPAIAADIFAIAQFLGVAPDALEHLPPGTDAGDPQQFEAVLQQAHAAALLPAHLTLEQARDLYRTLWGNVSAMIRARARYAPGRYPGEVLLFQAGDNPATAGIDLAADWRALADSVERHVVPGDHYSILRAPQVAALLQQQLDWAGLVEPEAVAALGPTSL